MANTFKLISLKAAEFTCDADTSHKAKDLIIFRSCSAQTCTAAVPLESVWTVVNGMTLHARVSIGPIGSDRPAVVLVHGLGMSSRYMVPLADCLSPYVQVYAPDLPGSGLSDKPARPFSVRESADILAAWTEAAGLQQAIFIGNSLGCETLVDLAVRHPGRVVSMVLQGPTADPRHLSPLQQIGRFMVTGLFERWSLGWVALSDYLRFGMRPYYETFREMIANRIEHKLPLVTVPTLVVWGNRDYIVPRRSVQRVAELIPKGKARGHSRRGARDELFAPQTSRAMRAGIHGRPERDSYQVSLIVTHEPIGACRLT